MRISCQSRALCIAVSSLDIVSSEFSLPVGKASNLLCQGQSPMGFSTGFVFSKTKSRARRTRSGPNGPNWAENYSTKTMLVPLVPLVPPFPKNFFKKLLPVEKVICVNQSKILSCMVWDSLAQRVSIHFDVAKSRTVHWQLGWFAITSK